MESAKEEAHEMPLSLEQEDQDAESEIEQMSLSELSLSVLSGSLESEVVQCYDKLRKLKLTLMDQVIKLNLNEGEFHEDAIVSLQKQIFMIQVMLKLLKQTLAQKKKKKKLGWFKETFLVQSDFLFFFFFFSFWGRLYSISSS